MQHIHTLFALILSITAFLYGPSVSFDNTTPYNLKIKFNDGTNTHKVVEPNSRNSWDIQQGRWTRRITVSLNEPNLTVPEPRILTYTDDLLETRKEITIKTTRSSTGQEIFFFYDLDPVPTVLK